jgi:hypothetical protein
MVDTKRLERKLPILLTNGPWFSSELDRNEWQLKKFKQQYPDKFIMRRNNIINELEALHNDIEAAAKARRAHR